MFKEQRNHSQPQAEMLGVHLLSSEQLPLCPFPSGRGSSQPICRVHPGLRFHEEPGEHMAQPSAGTCARPGTEGRCKSSSPAQG